MTGEIDKILKGKVEATMDYDMNKKVIGVSLTNLLPNEKGIVPLSKQDAFIQEQQEQSQIVEEAMQTTIDTPTTSEGSILPEPKQEEVIMENPLEVENPSVLEGLSVSSENEVVSPVVEGVKDETEYKFLDIQMPQMPDEVVAKEPETTNENLFETSEINNTMEAQIQEPTTEASQNLTTEQTGVLPQLDLEQPLTIETTNPQPVVQEQQLEPVNPLIEEPQQVVSPQVETEVQPMELINPIVEDSQQEVSSEVEPEPQPMLEQLPKSEIVDLDQVLENKKNELVNRINELTIKYTEEINELIKQEIQKTQTSVFQETLNPIVNDAINQINNMVIPTEQPVQQEQANNSMFSSM